MTTTPHQPRQHRRPRLVGLGATVAALALTAGLVPGGSAVAHPAGKPSPHHVSTQGRTVDVMTRNLYLGADLNPVLLALASGSSNAVIAAATETWAAVQATRPEERLGAIADEIVRADPEVVGLQEVTTWTTYAFNPSNQQVSDPVVAYDFLDLLLDELQERGVEYREVEGATADNFGSPPIPILAGAPFPTRAVQLADRDVIIARDDVRTSEPRTGTYQNIVGFPYNGDELPVLRGWGSVDVRAGRTEFRFVNSHLEAFAVPGVDAEAVRVAQVGELLAAQDALADEIDPLPMVYVGDYNSRAPDAAAYRRLVAGVGSDTWRATGRGGAGFTCCFDAAVGDPDDPLTSRIDLVLVSRDVKAPRTRVVGDDPDELTASGLWPSDHAGVVARVVIPAGKGHGGTRDARPAGRS